MVMVCVSTCWYAWQALRMTAELLHALDNCLHELDRHQCLNMLAWQLRWSDASSVVRHTYKCVLC